MTKQTGRTFWDFLSENTRLAVILIAAIILLIGFAVSKGVTISSPQLTIEPPKKEAPDQEVTADQETIPAEPSSTKQKKSSTDEKTPTTPASNNQKENFLIAGQVLDQDNNPIAEVRVSCVGLAKPVQTDQGGNFSFQLSRKPPAEGYVLSFSKDGYKSNSRTYYQTPKTDIVEFLMPN